jgi:hypothetical protein
MSLGIVAFLCSSYATENEQRLSNSMEWKTYLVLIRGNWSISQTDISHQLFGEETVQSKWN